MKYPIWGGEEDVWFGKIILSAPQRKEFRALVLVLGKVMLSKLLWRFAIGERNCRGMMIKEKFGFGKGHCSWGRKGTNKPWHLTSYSEKLESFPGIHWDIGGDGLRSKFWLHIWCGGQSSEDHFPVIFCLLADRSAEGCFRLKDAQSD